MMLMYGNFFPFRHQKYIGKVNHAIFHTQKAGRKRVVVATEENVIASLDLRRGEICMSLHGVKDFLIYQFNVL